MPAGFKIVKTDRDLGHVLLPVSSLTVAVGDLLELGAGSATWAKVTSSSAHHTRKAIVVKAATSASEVEAIELDGTETVEVQSANASNVSHNGDRMAFTDENTVNNSGTDVTTQAVGFIQDGTIGATSDNRILGKVLVGTGVDYDAA